MLSTSKEVVVCPYCKQHTLIRELNNDSLEDNWHCTSCGFVREFKFLKDNNGNLVEFNQEIFRDRLYFVIVDETTAKIIWKKSIPSIIDLPEEMFRFLSNEKYDNLYYDSPVPTGIRFLAYQDASNTLIIFSNGFDVDSDYNNVWHINANIMDLRSNDSIIIKSYNEYDFMSAYHTSKNSYDEKIRYSKWLSSKTNKYEYIMFD